MEKQEIHDFVRKMEDEGYAIIIWTPEELEGMSIQKMKDLSIQCGWEFIGMNKENDNV
jgi:ABC-type sugar transport system ATPase subunit